MGQGYCPVAALAESQDRDVEDCSPETDRRCRERAQSEVLRLEAISKCKAHKGLSQIGTKDR